MRHEQLEKQLCAAFCGPISVRATPAGLAISSAFLDASGDPIQLYLSESADGYSIEDDGEYLAHLAARDIPILQGSRGQILEAILEQGRAYWDKDTYEIRTSAFPESEISQRVIDFLSSMIRVRDLELLTRETIRSTFREDVRAAMANAFGERVSIEEDQAPSAALTEFPADLVVRPKQGAPGRTGAIYLVNSSDKLNEALLAHIEGGDDVSVVAVIEDPDMRAISRKKFQRAQNRSLRMPIFRGDESGSMRLIGDTLGLGMAA